MEAPAPVFIVVISGATGVGKSTMARRLAGALGVPHLFSGDLLRAALRTTAADPEHPIHFNSYSVPDAAGQLPTSRAGIVAGYARQSEPVVAAAASALRWAISEGWPVIVEGVHFQPGLLPAALTGCGVPVMELSLHLADEREHRQRIADRAASSGRTTNLDRFDRIRAIQEHLVGCAAANGVPVVEVHDPDAALREAVVCVSSMLADTGLVAGGDA